MARPPHADVRLVALVAAGGAVGTAGRAGLGALLPTDGGLPVATLAVNLVASLALGFLLEALVSAHGESPRRRVLRLGVGTGVLGGLSTYSSLALEVQEMLARGDGAPALAYALGTVLAGALVCCGGITLAAALRGGTERRVAGSADRGAGGGDDRGHDMDRTRETDR